MSEKEIKQLGGNIISTKQEERNGVQVGIIEGYIATWDIDRGDWFGTKDKFIRGAFEKSIAEHREKRRQIRFKDHHDRTIGGFPIENVREDDTGLFGIAEVNLGVQQGREAFVLAKQGVLTDFSIGFSVVDSTMDNDVRSIHEAMIWEGSIVDEPMNPKATVTDVKAVVPFQDLPLTDRDMAWDSSAAVARVRDFTGSETSPSERYRRAFVWYDRENDQNFGAFKLPIADIVDGRMVAVPRAIFAAAGALQGARGGVDIPENDRAGVIRHIERYYAKMDLESPFSDDEKQYHVADEVRKWSQRDIEQALRKSGVFSKNAAKVLASRLNDEEPEVIPDGNESELLQKMLDGINEFKKTLTTA